MNTFLGAVLDNSAASSQVYHLISSAEAMVSITGSTSFVSSVGIVSEDVLNKVIMYKNVKVIAIRCIVVIKDMTEQAKSLIS